MSRWDALMPAVVAQRRGSNDMPPLQLLAVVRGIEETVEATKRRVKQIEKSLERNRAVMNDVRSITSRFDDLFTKTNSDIQYIQQQLEYVVIGLEREHGIVADHTEQLRLFVRESNRRNGRTSESADNTISFLFWVATWLYQPLMHFAKGCYTLLSPLINTLHSLSLFNSNILVRQTGNSTRFHNTKTSEDLLKSLQKGMLDPISVAKRK